MVSEAHAAAVSHTVPDAGGLIRHSAEPSHAVPESHAVEASHAVSEVTMVPETHAIEASHAVSEAVVPESMMDYSSVGMPSLRISTAADFEIGEEAELFLHALRRLIQY
ncbi:MAG: hypothetical protein LBC46_00920, partial [Treponema sp.]|nr:hypothetical protein [Treponema sp.]